MNNVSIDSGEVDRLLNNLGDEELLNKILFDAIKAGAKVLQEATKKQFRSEMGDAASHISKYTHRPFESGVTLKTDKAYTEAKVSIMGDHRMKWFEKGTQDRYTKGYKITGYQRNRAIRSGKGHWTGHIIGKHFFKQAKENSESTVNDAIKQSINNALKKLDE